MAHSFTPARVRALGALGGEWESWCDAGGAKSKYGGNVDACKTVIPFTPPWTDAGAIARFVAAGVRIPGIDEYAPHNLFRVSYEDPFRFAVLTAYATVVAGPIGSGLVGRFAPIVNVAALPEAITSALVAGGWDSVGRNIVAPVLDVAPQVADAVLSTLLGGASGGVQAALRQVSRNLKRRFPGNDTFAVITAVLDAVAERALVIADLLRNPQALKQEGTYAQLGDSLQHFSTFVSGVARDFLRATGEAMVTFQHSIAPAARGDLKTAADNITTSPNLLGAPISKIRDNIKEGLMNAKLVVQRITTDKVGLLQRFDGLLKEIQTSLGYVNAGGAFQSLIDALGGFRAEIASFLKSLRDLVMEAQATVGAGGGSAGAGSGSGAEGPAMTVEEARLQLAKELGRRTQTAGTVQAEGEAAKRRGRQVVIVAVAVAGAGAVGLIAARLLRRGKLATATRSMTEQRFQRVQPQRIPAMAGLGFRRRRRRR